MPKPGQPSDDPSSAPESGTVRDQTAGTDPADRGNAADSAAADPTRRPKDDSSQANEEK